MLSSAWGGGGLENIRGGVKVAVGRKRKESEIGTLLKQK